MRSKEKKSEGVRGCDLADAVTNFSGGLGLRRGVFTGVEITREHVARQTGTNADFGNAVLCNRQKQGNEPQKHQLCQCSADHEFK